jgi:hypothetical protein
MFDEDSKTTFLVVAAAAILLTLTLNRAAPLTDVETAVDLAGLPPLPLGAAPDGSPAQTRVAATEVELGHGFRAELLYGYALEGLVVTRRTFRNDPTSAVSPLDLGIVWGDLAEPGAVEGWSFHARPRAVSYRPGPDAVLPDDWESQVTNNHLIPANQTVNDALMAVEVGDRVRIRGFLVVVTGDGIVPWRSSIRRNDNTIIGGCEIILVTGVEVLRPEAKAA